jgi:hypothetical protein
MEIDPEPRLIIFGFDQDQREDTIWRHHFERLKEEFSLTVYAVGDPASSKGASTRRGASKSRNVDRR